MRFSGLWPMEGTIIRKSSRSSKGIFDFRSKSSSYRRVYRRLFKKTRRRVVRYGIVTANLAVLVLVVALITGNPDSGDVVRQNSVNAESAVAAASPLDQLSSADIAVHAARLTALPEAAAIISQADIEATQLTVSGTDSKIVTKPQIVTTSLKSARDIVVYVAVEGDTLSKLADRFGVTSDSIRWSNGLSGDIVSAGTKLLIPPVNGIVYTVKAGETADVLARRYSASKQQILADNDAEISGLKVGQRILIRSGTQPSLSSSAGDGFFVGVPSYSGNAYDPGYCTWYVANKRLASGMPMPSNLGDASQWAIRASRYGLATGSSPRVGAAVVTATRGWGHVAYVERVNSDGSIYISEMNANWIRYQVTTRTVPADQAARYSYIY